MGRSGRPQGQRGAECQAPGLRQAREAAGLSQAELAERVGCYTTGQLNAIEQGQVVPCVAVSRIAAALGVDPAMLRGYTS